MGDNPSHHCCTTNRTSAAQQASPLAHCTSPWEDQVLDAKGVWFFLFVGSVVYFRKNRQTMPLPDVPNLNRRYMARQPFIS
ncbi:hypothetical protein CBM2634_U20081 [Cupriavidus taiwanensis]|uniref:Uncharacterized protein n=1 Tax=Cupriavidus taiwanensis TaxID=164546 RepID=A0A375JGC1_9BURK|nr:hypothetical protein CBM2634_U20081 [Cupriavidus taiwanensis]